ncbi:MAG: cellulose synthase complex periplasmic endoglucanase BcsZ [Myxococcota bacterium]
MSRALFLAAAAVGGCAATGLESAPTDLSSPREKDAPLSPTPLARCSWPLWEAYAEAFIENGRVVDRTDRHRTVSEGQAYGLFFALVADDPARFDALLAWTRDNLLGGNWDEGLPAWLWGQSKDRHWKVLDPNSATDADLWIGHTLLEAARLWNRPELAEMGSALLERVLASNLRQLPGLGPVLLPAPRGFEIRPGKRWRLNPSYVVPVQLARLAALGLPGPWAELATTGERLLVETSTAGLHPDWVIYDAAAGWIPDTQAAPASSYDAIRVPLFVELGAPDAVRSAASGWLQRFSQSGRLTDRVPLYGTTHSSPRPAPVAYYAVLLPGARRTSPETLYESVRERVSRFSRGPLYGSPPAYYDQNLVLFGLGFVENRFRFGSRGELEVAWSETPCETS